MLKPVDHRHNALLNNIFAMEDQTEIDERTLDFLVIKSRKLLNGQFKSYDSAINKSGLLISILSIIIPIAIYMVSKDMNCAIKLFGIIPISLLIIAMSLLLKVLLPKNLDTGFNFNRFEQKLSERYTDLLLYEIGANKSSFIDNQIIVDKQNLFLKKGVILVYCGSISLIILLLINLLI